MITFLILTMVVCFAFCLWQHREESFTAYLESRLKWSRQISDNFYAEVCREVHTRTASIRLQFEKLLFDHNRGRDKWAVSELDKLRRNVVYEVLESHRKYICFVTKPDAGFLSAMIEKRVDMKTFGFRMAIGLSDETPPEFIIEEVVKHVQDSIVLSIMKEWGHQSLLK